MDHQSVWFHALEFADLLVPIFSFCYSGIGLVLIVFSIRQSDVWCKAYHITIIELLSKYLNESKKISFKLAWKPLTRIISAVEFVIINIIFCNNYKVKRNSFNFVEYVELVYEKYVFSIIHMHTSDWLFILFGYLVEYVAEISQMGI